MALLLAKKRVKSDNDPTLLAGAFRVLDYMFTLWQAQRLCDVLVVARDGEVKAHRIALGSYSEPLTKTFAEYGAGDLVRLDLSDFGAEAVMAILRFVYTTELELSCHVVGQALSCANQLGMDVVVHVCVDYLRHVSVENAILHYSVAENNRLSDLRDQIHDFILDNFAEVAGGKHFLYVPYERLRSLLCDDSLCVDDELDVFRAIVRWVDFARADRLRHAYALLGCVRFSLIPAEQIVTNVEIVDWIFAEVGSWKDYLYQAMK